MSSTHPSKEKLPAAEGVVTRSPSSDCRVTDSPEKASEGTPVRSPCTTTVCRVLSSRRKVSRGSEPLGLRPREGAAVAETTAGEAGPVGGA